MEGERRHIGETKWDDKWSLQLFRMVGTLHASVCNLVMAGRKLISSLSIRYCRQGEVLTGNKNNLSLTWCWWWLFRKCMHAIEWEVSSCLVVTPAESNIPSICPKGCLSEEVLMFFLKYLWIQQIHSRRVRLLLWNGHGYWMTVMTGLKKPVDPNRRVDADASSAKQNWS